MNEFFETDKQMYHHRHNIMLQKSLKILKLHLQLQLKRRTKLMTLQTTILNSYIQSSDQYKIINPGKWDLRRCQPF